MIKVYCGLLAAGKIRSASGRVLARSSLDCSLLRCLMGVDALNSPLGLYMHSFEGQTRHAGGFSFATIMLSDGSDGVGGLMLSLGLMNFVLVTSSRYGQTFSDRNWYRHQTLAFNIEHGRSRIGYLFTY